MRVAAGEKVFKRIRTLLLLSLHANNANTEYRGTALQCKAAVVPILDRNEEIISTASIYLEPITYTSLIRLNFVPGIAGEFHQCIQVESSTSIQSTVLHASMLNAPKMHLQ